MARIVETTDAPETVATSYLMQVGDEFYGKASKGAADWVAVHLEAGHTYTFGAVGIGALNTGVTNTKLFLHDSAGAAISGAFDDNGGPGRSSSLTFTAAASGTYFVEVKSLAGAFQGDYGLALTEGNRVSFGVDMGAAELYRLGLSWAATPQTATTVTWGFRYSGPATDASGDAAPFHQLTLAQQHATEYALANFADVANITFQQVHPGGFTNQATILVGAYTSTSDGAGAYAMYPGSTLAGSSAGDLWINTDSVNGGKIAMGSYSQFVFLHELGHAMGLAHPGDYNAAPGVTITYDNSAQFAEDSAQYTVMSYFDAIDTEAGAPKHYADTLMMYDIYALQQLYGVNTATHAGNDTYGFRATVGGAYDFATNKTPLLCIWDGAGKDTLNLSGFTQAQRIDLNAGHFSDVGGYKGNVSIALGCSIENAVGGSGSDVITGNAGINRLFGRGGDDTLIGGAGADRLTGDGGADTFVFSAGSGKDIVTDFDSVLDVLSLAASLWGGGVKTAADVVHDFARMVNNHVVLDFGADEISLVNLHSTTGLAGHILIE
jgi:serralysin